MHTQLLALAAVACYFTGGALIGLRLLRPDQPYAPPRALALLPGYAALLLHLFSLYQELVTPVGFNLGFFSVGALVGWTVVALLMISALTKPVENLGILLMPMAGITVILALRFPDLKLLGGASQPGLNAHILLSLVAYSLLMLAAVQALLLAVQEQHLHNRHPGGFIRALPPLQTMETLLFEMIGVGFFLLSLALISGFVYLEDMLAQHIVHKTILSLISWLVFATLLWGRFQFGWRGRTAIRWALSGFVLLALAYFGSKFVLEFVLRV
ncbi:MAG: cytochrome c biogenesis protein CcsA [Gammaproteobacteria bacterium SHHR-1]|uniref:cytochrome C assembly family protein n=1 Tax=Magnetovirga frankeli TaxID=947516 RepID=UPI00129366B3|nr:cytochrome c biogenesis protein CcsA [gamma proteobacterium SS-5]